MEYTITIESDKQLKLNFSNDSLLKSCTEIER